MLARAAFPGPWVFSIMAVWLASYSDGGWRERRFQDHEKLSDRRHYLATPPWVTSLVDRVGGSGLADQIFYSRGGGAANRADVLGPVHVRSLLRLADSGGATCNVLWQTQWSREMALLNEYYEFPQDNYSLMISDQWACNERTHCAMCFGIGQKALSKRQTTYSRRRDIFAMAPNRKLVLGDWGGPIMEVVLPSGVIILLHQPFKNSTSRKSKCQFP